jgi:DNA-binding XRE family transcriptional regulator
MAKVLPSPLRARRRQCGLTQTELATRAGVSRQLVAAVESGQNTPGVDAALRLARALSTTVEELFGDAPADWVAALGDELPAGVPLRVGTVGHRMVAVQLSDHGTAGAGWAAPDGVLDGDRLTLFPGAAPAGLVLAGCDPALGVAEAMLRGLGGRSLMSISAPTGAALAALAAGRLHAAVVHGRAGELPRPPLPVTRLHLARWQVGVGMAPALHRGSLEDLLQGDVAVVRRDPAAASQQAFDRAVQRTGAGPAAFGPLAGGHIEAARLAGVLGTAGVTNEAAARAFGLRFIPLEDHVVEIWLDRRWRDHPGVDALGELLCARAFTDRIAQFGGYDLAGCGSPAGD